MTKTELVERCKAGDKYAIGFLYSEYREQLLTVCKRYVKDLCTCEDIFHDAFIMIVTSLPNLKNVNKLEAWMSTIVRNYTLRYLNEQNRQNYVSLQYDFIEDVSNENVLPIDLDTIMNLVNELPSGYQQVFRMSVFEGLSHKEIAEELGIAPHSSSSQLSRAKGIMRKMIQKHWILLALLPIIPMLLFYNMFYEKTSTEMVQNNRKKYAVKKNPNAVIEQIENTDNQNLTIADNQKNTIIRIEIPEEQINCVLPDSQTTSEYNEIAEENNIPMPDDTIVYDRYFDLFATDETFVLSSKKRDDHTWTLSVEWATQLTASDTELNNSLTLVDFASDGTARGTVRVNNWAEYDNYAFNNSNYINPLLNSYLMNNTQANSSSDEAFVENVHHHKPFTFSLLFNKKIDNRFGFSTGLSYTAMKSTFEGVETCTQRLNYIGVPFKLYYDIWRHQSYSLHASAGTQLDLPIACKREMVISYPYKQKLKESITPNLQFSLGVGLGLQYTITPYVNLFVEPSLQYFIPSGGSIESYRTEHPISFTMPFGLFFSW